MRRLFKVTALLSSSSLVEITLNIIKTKLLALLTGPTGVGLMGLYQSLINLLRSLASVFAGAGVVQVAAPLPDEQKADLYRALLRYVLGVSGLVTLALILFSRPVAVFFFNDAGRYKELIGFALITPVIFLGIFWRSWLNALRQVKSLAKLKIMATSTVVVTTVVLVWVWKLKGVYLAALLYPVPLAMLAWRALKKVFPAAQPQPALSEHQAIDISARIRQVLATGQTLLISSLLFTGSVLFVKGLINRQLGTQALGYFQASWTLAMVYIELLLAALGMDFFPRLATACADKRTTNALINQQLAFTLMLSMPVILALMLLAPWALQWLYSRQFLPADGVLQWQLTGDFFKVISWVLGYVLIAHKKLGQSLVIQLLWVSLFSAGSVLLMPGYGIHAPGMAFALAYAGSAGLSLGLVAHQLGWRPDRHAGLAVITTLAVAAITLISFSFPTHRSGLLALLFLFSLSVSVSWLWRQWHQETEDNPS